MHTTMVPEQVNTMKIQAGAKVSRPEELRRHLQLWKCFGRLYYVVIVLVRNILIQLMHTTMVPEQVKTIKIQAGAKVSRPEELRRHLQLWKCFGRLYYVVIVLVRDIVSNSVFPRIGGRLLALKYVD
ncbi:hypothetical protein Tco_1085158 [Tanacetum coccineum]